jgi:predicted ATPase
LVGREEEIKRGCRLLLQDDTALVSLTGPGGTGKTRLALALGQELLDSFSDGVFFVDLATITDPALVIPAVAQALSLRESGSKSITETLTEHLAGKEMLLILDNFEQVIEAAPEVSSLLASARGLKVLVTTREPLHLRGELELEVAPLGLPPPEAEDLATLVSSPAVKLFTERAGAVKASFELSEDNAASVTEICRRLDGLPLALELAAARIRTMSPSSLLARLDRSLEVLSGGARDLADRQRTLRAAISWSYELLDEDEKRLFGRLGVFAGGFTSDAAEVVCDREDLSVPVWDGVSSLVDKSLVRLNDTDEERFSMLETIRSFALEKLEASGETEEIRRAHAEFFRGLAEEAEPHLVGADQKQWLVLLDRELPNLRDAFHWWSKCSAGDWRQRSPRCDDSGGAAVI